MSWLGRLCETYDSVIGCACDEGNPLLPVGFVKKTVKFHVCWTAREGLYQPKNCPRTRRTRFPARLKRKREPGAKASRIL